MTEHPAEHPTEHITDSPTDQVGYLCDVGGCVNPFHLRWEGWLVCQEHFRAYLNDKFDLKTYFHIKLCKEQGISADWSLIDDDLFAAVNEEVGVGPVLSKPASPH